MTKRSPDKREQKRLKKIEDGKQAKRYRMIRDVMDGLSLRDTAERHRVSHSCVKYWVDRLLEKRTIVEFVQGQPLRKIVYELRENHRELVNTRRTGPEPGNCPKV